MKIDARIEITASTNQQNDFIVDEIKKYFQSKGMMVIMEHRNIFVVNGEAKEIGNRIEYHKIAKGRK